MFSKWQLLSYHQESHHASAQKLFNKNDTNIYIDFTISEGIWYLLPDGFPDSTQHRQDFTATFPPRGGSPLSRNKASLEQSISLKKDKILIFNLLYQFSQFSSVAQSCPTLCNPMNRSTPGLPVRHQLPEFTQTHVHRVSDAIQPSHPLSSHFPPAPNPSQHQSFFQ